MYKTNPPTVLGCGWLARWGSPWSLLSPPGDGHEDTEPAEQSHTQQHTVSNYQLSEVMSAQIVENFPGRRGRFQCNYKYLGGGVFLASKRIFLLLSLLIFLILRYQISNRNVKTLKKKVFFTIFWGESKNSNWQENTQKMLTLQGLKIS